MINFEALEKRTGVSYEFYELPKIDGEFVKKLRKKLNLTQTMFSLIMHVSKKTVEKWEQGKNPVTNGNAIAMYLFDKYPNFIQEFIYKKDNSKEPNNILVKFGTFGDEYESWNVQRHVYKNLKSNNCYGK